MELANENVTKLAAEAFSRLQQENLEPKQKDSIDQPYQVSEKNLNIFSTEFLANKLLALFHSSFDKQSGISKRKCT